MKGGTDVKVKKRKKKLAGDKKRRRVSSTRRPANKGPGRMIKVRVGELKSDGEHGVPCIITWPTSSELKWMGSITMEKTLLSWSEDDDPEPGDHLVVWNVWEKRQGWRAKFARRYREEDKGDTNIVQ